MENTRRNINADLLSSLEECIKYIEMTLAHDGAMSVNEIIERLRSVETVAYVETAHHLGCAKTTRRVDLAKARSAIARARSD